MNKVTFAIVLAFLALIAGGVALGYVATTPGDNNEPQVTVVDDSVITNNVIAQVSNPVFTTVDEVLSYQSQKWDELFIDSVFSNIPPEILEIVAKVRLGRLQQVTKKELVIEYLQHHQDIYKYIATDSIPLPPARAVDDILSCDTADTVINGKPYKLLTN